MRFMYALICLNFIARHIHILCKNYLPLKKIHFAIVAFFLLLLTHFPLFVIVRLFKEFSLRAISRTSNIFQYDELNCSTQMALMYSYQTY